ncbi:BatD family protein [Vibrio methylphosphonaticus]|uniref:BatD family protein n=1 Tax=Vibrio methylphosphonaticus TaxID=2946866 RepID=UPI00202A92CB|nr:BatD family protein [Vibrio methylphosphonaticus]MCL9776229.1 BatD family protein [Vibrio methylphosphonaticus]
MSLKSNFILVLLATVAMLPHSVLANEKGGSKIQTVKMSAWLGQKENSNRKNVSKNHEFTVNEQIILTIEVATPRWFTGGTRISRIDVPNLIAKQRNPLAINSTERINGVTWSKQRWEVTLYPQTSGTFVIPPVAIQTQVSTPNVRSVSRTLYTQPMSFDVSMPTGKLSEQQSWLSASDMSLTQQWEMSSDELKAGASITRTVTLNADDTLSILIPSLIPQEATHAYQVYRQPDRLSDSHERGAYNAQRTEQHTYVLQRGGNFTLPDIDVVWWNSNKKTLETVTLEGKTISVGHTFSSFVAQYQRWLVGVAILLITLIAGSVLLYRRVQQQGFSDGFHLLFALKNKNFSRLRLLTYRKLKMSQGQVALSTASNSADWKEQARQWQTGEESTSLLMQVWRKVSLKQGEEVATQSQKGRSALTALRKRICPPALTLPEDSRREHSQ